MDSQTVIESVEGITPDQQSSTTTTTTTISTVTTVEASSSSSPASKPEKQKRQRYDSGKKIAIFRVLLAQQIFPHKDPKKYEGVSKGIARKWFAQAKALREGYADRNDAITDEIILSTLSSKTRGRPKKFFANEKEEKDTLELMKNNLNDSIPELRAKYFRMFRKEISVGSLRRFLKINGLWKKMSEERHAKKKSEKLKKVSSSEPTSTTTTTSSTTLQEKVNVDSDDDDDDDDENDDDDYDENDDDEISTDHSGTKRKLSSADDDKHEQNYIKGNSYAAKLYKNPRRKRQERFFTVEEHADNDDNDVDD